MTRNKNIDNDDVDASSTMKRFKTCDNGGGGPWSDLNHEVLYLVMMQLGVVDYLSFGGVCKSWRSLAMSERNTFMASKPPMIIRIDWRTHKKTCYLEDFEGRKFRTILASFAGGSFVGLTCGYLIFFRRTTHDFWLVNPVTRYQLCFTNFPLKYKKDTHFIRAILVFSRSACGWVLVLMLKHSKKIWFSIVGTGAWSHVYNGCHFADLRAFKGKIYVLNYFNPDNFNPRSRLWKLYELRLNPEPKLTLLETKNSLKPTSIAELVSSGESMYVMDRDPNGFIYTMHCTPEARYRFQELDFGEMKWLSYEKTLGECASFLSNLKYGVVDKCVFHESRGEGLLLGHNAGDTLKIIDMENTGSFDSNTWYFSHECLNADIVD